MPRQSGAQRNTVGRMMHEYKHGKLESSTGRKVRNPKQAIAIGLSEAGASRKQSPGQKRRALQRTKSREAKGRTSASGARTARQRDGGLTRAELYRQATERGIEGRSRMSKAQLARALKRSR